MSQVVAALTPAERRRRLKLDQREVAEAIGCHPTQVSVVEKAVTPGGLGDRFLRLLEEREREAAE